MLIIAIIESIIKVFIHDYYLWYNWMEWLED